MNLNPSVGRLQVAAKEISPDGEINLILARFLLAESHAPPWPRQNETPDPLRWALFQCLHTTYEISPLFSRGVRLVRKGVEDLLFLLVVRTEHLRQMTSSLMELVEAKPGGTLGCLFHFLFNGAQQRLNFLVLQEHYSGWATGATGILLDRREEILLFHANVPPQANRKFLERLTRCGYLVIVNKFDKPGEGGIQAGMVGLQEVGKGSVRATLLFTLDDLNAPHFRIFFQGPPVKIVRMLELELMQQGLRMVIINEAKRAPFGKLSVGGVLH